MIWAKILQSTMKQFNNKLITSIYIVILVFVSFMLLPRSTFAQEKMIRVTPVILNLELKKGQEQTYEVKIENLLSAPMGIETNIESLDASDEETGIRFDLPKQNESFVSWITTSEKDLIIPENGKKNIEIKIKVPKNIKEGGYQGVLFLTPFITKPLDNLSPTVTSRVGILILANIGTPKAAPAKDKARIVEFSFKQVFDKGPADLILRVKNIFPFIIPSKAEVLITPLFGKQQIVELEDKRILPGKIRKWQKDIALNPGFYKAQAALSLYQGQLLFKDTYFLVLPVKGISMYLILVPFILVIFLIRKRLKKAFLVLVQKSP